MAEIDVRLRAISWRHEWLDESVEVFDMNPSYRAGVFAACLSLFCLPGFTQHLSGQVPETGQIQPTLPPQTNPGHILLDVVVTDRSGKPMPGLAEKDFVVRNNGTPQKILSFQAVGGETAISEVKPTQTPVKIILLVDEVNTTFDRVAYERNQIKKFLSQNGGKLPQPMSLAFFSDTGTEIQNHASQDGNALLASFDQHQNSLRTIRRSAGFYGAEERLDLSLNTLSRLAAAEAQEPGRKMVIWISPGWPLLSGPGIQLTSKQQQHLFATITSVSTALRQARITIYSIDPLGLADAGGVRVLYYQEFLKPVTAVKNVQIGNLGLQVLATQTGGLALNSSNDITAQITRCIAEADAFYTLTIDAAPADTPNDFHSVDVKVETPGLTARTRNGYYAQP
jgi:VWFA-related protein